MVEHLKIDGVSLATAKGQLSMAIGQFNLGNAPTNQVADSVGHAGLAESLRKFGSDWSIKREKLAEKLSALEANLEQSIQAFGDWDKGAAEALTVNKSGQAPQTPTPAPANSPSGAGAHKTEGFGGGGFGGGGASGGWQDPPPPVPNTAETPAPGPGSISPTDPAVPQPGAPVDPTVGGERNPLNAIINRLAQTVSGWESMGQQEQALLFTAIGTAGLTLLVRAGKLPPSVLDLVTRPGKGTRPFPREGAHPSSDTPPRTPQDGVPNPPQDVPVPTEESLPVEPESEPTIPEGSSVDGEAPSTDEVSMTTEASPGQPDPVLPALPDLAEPPSSDAEGGAASGSAAGGGGGGGGGAALPDIPATGEEPSTNTLPDIPPLAEVLDSSASSDVGSSGAPRAELPPLAASLGRHEDSTLAPLEADAGPSMGMGMSAGMGMASLSNTLGSAANTTSAALSSKADQEAKIKDAVKALKELREESKETKR